MLLYRKCVGRLIIGFTSLYIGHVVATGCKKLENMTLVLPLLALTFILYFAKISELMLLLEESRNDVLFDGH
jgi:hypothetical protein